MTLDHPWERRTPVRPGRSASHTAAVAREPRPHWGAAPPADGMMIKAPDCPAGHPSCLILGDNIFHGQGLGDYLKGLLRRGWN